MVTAACRGCNIQCMFSNADYNEDAFDENDSALCIDALTYVIFSV